MASTIASPSDGSSDSSRRRTRNKITKPKYTEDEESKQTSVEKTGGILCHICCTIFSRKKEYDSHYAGHKTSEPETVYSCVTCKKQVSGYIKFLSHCYLTHVVRNKFQCETCQKTFSKLAALNSHISLMHEFQCNFCFEKFTCKRELETHKKISHIMGGKGKNAPPYNCNMCQATLDSLDSCELHIDEHCKIEYPCPICQEPLPDKQFAIEHMTKHFVQREDVDPTADTCSQEGSSIDVLGGIVCCHCDEIFSCRPDIDSHFEEEHPDKTISYTCNICRNSFEKYHLFGAHCYNHYSKDRFKCDECNKTFPRLSLLVLHTELYHIINSPDKQDKPFKCTECERGFRSSARLHEHRRLLHSAENCIYHCTRPGCTQKFGKPSELITHMKVHSTWLESWCRRCGLQLPALRAAARHLPVHRVARYHCPVCPRHYRERYLLVKHVAAHFATSFHVCAVCGKAYAARSRLAQHAKTHGRPRAHACSACPKAFATRAALAQHASTHAARPYACSVCPKTFASYPNWQRHLSRLHRLDAQAIRRLRTSLPPPPPLPAPPPPPPPADVYTFESDSEADIKREKPAPPNTLSIAEKVRNCIDALDDSFDIAPSDTSPDHDPVERCHIEPELEMKNDITDSNNLVDYDTNPILIPELKDNSIPVDYDMIEPKPQEIKDDSSDIAAIVDHIEELEAAHAPALQTHYSHPAYAPLLQPEYAVISAVEPVPAPPTPAEYGPDFTVDTATLAGEEHLPHINPLLTMAPLDRKGAASPGGEVRLRWPPPIITKLYHYEQTDPNTIYTIFY